MAGTFDYAESRIVFEIQHLDIIVKFFLFLLQLFLDAASN